MNADTPDDLAPRCRRQQDLTALIGLLAVLEGEIWADAVPSHLPDRISKRLATETLVGVTPTERELRQTINDLNHRLRYALGEYDKLPSSLPVAE